MKHGSLRAFVKDECRCDSCTKAYEHGNHGTQYSYYVLGCRCEQCELYWALGSPLREDDVRHGTINAYRNHRCRCMSCKVANAGAQSDYRRRQKKAAKRFPEEG